MSAGYQDNKTASARLPDLSSKRLMYESMRQDATVGFLKCALNPSLYNTPPPSVDLRSDFSKDGTIIGNFVIPSTPLVKEMVPYTSGMILWLCNNGLTACYRQHFVPIGTVSTVGSGTNSQNQGLLGPQLDFEPNSVATDQYGIIASLTYFGQLALPVSSNFTVGNQIAVAYDPLMNQVAYSRMYAGVVRAVSASTSISSGTVLTGTFTAASIEDTRGVSQDSNLNAFSIATMTQASETSKDYVAQIPNDQGVAVLLGDDVPVEYTNPYQDQSVIANGQCAIYPSGLTEVDFDTINVTAGNWVSAFSVQFMAAFITPWAITAQTRATGLSANIATIQTFPIGETEVLKIKMVVPAAIVQNDAGDDDGCTNRIAAIATHIFATVDMTGTIQYSSFTEERNLRTGGPWDMYADGVNVQTRNTQPNTNHPPFFTPRAGQAFPSPTQIYGQTVEFDPITFRQSYTIQGKYLGSYIAIAGGPSSYTGSFYPWLGTGYWFAVGSPTFYVTTTAANVPGRVGPARIIRWDNMGQGMQLAISGKIWAQSIPTSFLSPYVKASIMGKQRWCDEAATTLLAALCSGPGPIRRVWVEKEYTRFINEDLPNMDLAKIVSYAANNDMAISALMDIAPMALGGRRERE